MFYQQPVYQSEYPAPPLYPHQPRCVDGPVYAFRPEYVPQHNYNNAVFANASKSKLQQQRRVCKRDPTSKSFRISPTLWILSIIFWLCACPFYWIPCLCPCCHEYF